MKESLAARGALHMGVERFVSKYPLLGALVASWKIVEDSAIETAGVAASDPGIELRYNPEFLLQLRPDELVGVLHHEARHCIYGHIFMDPAAYPDVQALINAQEVTVNENLPEPLPGSPILLKQFPGLPPDEDTETRYRRLAKTSGKTAVAKGAGKKNASAQTAPADSADAHSRWGTFHGRESATKAMIEAAMKEGLQSCLAARSGLSEEDQAALSIAEMTCGAGPGDWKTELKNGRPGTLPWQKLLRRYVGASGTQSYSFAVPPRRFSHLLGILPGSRRSAHSPVIQAVIDTSGSLTDEMLADISKELSNLACDFEVIVVEADELVQRVYTYTKPITDAQGRGGTSFIPALEAQVLRRTKAELVLYFTDGCGPAPIRAPRVPVIWVLTENGVVPAKWGRVVYMDRKSVGTGPK